MFLGFRKLSHSHTMYRTRKYSQFLTNFKIMTLACTAKSYIEHGFMLYWINRWRCSNFVLHEHGKWASQAHAGIHMIWIRNYLYTDCIWCHSVTTYILTAYDVIVSCMLLTVKVMNDGGSFCLWSVLSLLVLHTVQTVYRCCSTALETARSCRGHHSKISNITLILRRCFIVSNKW